MVCVKRGKNEEKRGTNVKIGDSVQCVPESDPEAGVQTTELPKPNLSPKASETVG